jgi:hypothetical protein
LQPWIVDGGDGVCGFPVGHGLKYEEVNKSECMGRRSTFNSHLSLRHMADNVSWRSNA